MLNFRKWLIFGGLLLIAIMLSNCRFLSPKTIASPSVQDDNTPTQKPTRLGAIPDTAVKIQTAQDPTPPILHNPEWEQPVPMNAPINTAGAEDSPFILPDGSTLYFFFTPDVKVPPEQQILDGVTGIYVSHKEDSGWTEPERVFLSDQRELTLDGCPFVLENELWFCSARKGNFRPLDFYTAEWHEQMWSDWKNTGEKLNVEYGLGEMHLSTDRKTLYYHADRPGGIGGLDIWTTSWGKDGWELPINLVEINTPELDGFPFLSPNSSELWFTRTYQGTPAIYRSLWEGKNWGEPQLVISQFAGEPTLDTAGNLYFVHHYYLDGKMVEADIYTAHKK